MVAAGGRGGSGPVGGGSGGGIYGCLDVNNLAWGVGFVSQQGSEDGHGGWGCSPKAEEQRPGLPSCCPLSAPRDWLCGQAGLLMGQPKCRLSPVGQ